jgi:hypothetical protein
MAALEHAAVEYGRWLLTLDTATPDAARLYERMGWSGSGLIPNYALNLDGSLAATLFYWKLAPEPAQRADPRLIHPQSLRLTTL